MAVGALEPHFYEALSEKLGIDEPQMSPHLAEKLAATFRQHPRAYWEALLQGSDACAAPVLSMNEAPAHPHNVARETFISRDGLLQPAPAPRFISKEN